MNKYSIGLLQKLNPLLCNSAVVGSGRHLVANSFSTSSLLEKSSGRYGHKLVKLWEQKEYTIKPLRVFRTGGRLPNVRPDGRVVPGRVWCSRHGGGYDREFRWVDHNRLTYDDVQNEVYYQERVELIFEDQMRAGNIALVTGPLKKRWVLATVGMKKGDLITNTAKEIVGVAPKAGDAMPLKLINTGTRVCSFEFYPGKGAQIARAGGNHATVLRHVGGRTIVKMPSGRDINVDSDCVAVIGQVSNPSHLDIHWGSPQFVMDLGLRPKKGIRINKNRIDGRFSKRTPQPHPVVSIGDKLKLTKDSHFED